MKKEIINNSRLLLLAFTLLFFSCQKDYYLDDLNDALAQIQTLQTRNVELTNKINELGSLINQKTSENSILQSQYDQLYSDFLESEAENEDLNNRLEALAEQLRQLLAIDNGIKDGYYVERSYGYTRNDTLRWEEEIAPEILFDVGNIAKVIDGEIVERFSIGYANRYWNLSSGDESKVKRKLYDNSIRYYHRNEKDTLIFLNPYTGDSLNYMTKYKVYDHDIFTANRYRPAVNNSLTTISHNVYYRLYSDPYQLTENISYPVVAADNNGYNNLGQYPGIYDYSSDSEFMSDSIYNQIDQDDPKSFLSAFILDAERNGLDLSMINPDDLVTKPWDFPTDQYGRYGVAAWGTINCSQTNNRIGYDLAFFKNNYLTDKLFWKLKVMYHEFGHTVLGLKHTCAYEHIMTSGSSGNYPCNGDAIYDGDLSNLDDFKRTVQLMFDGYNQFYYDCYINNTNGGKLLDIE